MGFRNRKELQVYQPQVAENGSTARVGLSIPGTFNPPRGVDLGNQIAQGVTKLVEIAAREYRERQNGLAEDALMAVSLDFERWKRDYKAKNQGVNALEAQKAFAAKYRELAESRLRNFRGDEVFHDNLRRNFLRQGLAATIEGGDYETRQKERWLSSQLEARQELFELMCLNNPANGAMLAQEREKLIAAWQERNPGLDVGGYAANLRLKEFNSRLKALNEAEDEAGLQNLAAEFRNLELSGPGTNFNQGTGNTAAHPRANSAGAQPAAQVNPAWSESKNSGQISGNIVSRDYGKAKLRLPVEIDNHLEAEAKRYNVSPDLVRAVIMTESSGRPNLTSRAGAYGYMQLMPGTARELGVDRNDPRQNISGGIKYLRQMLDRYHGDVVAALSAYNMGPGGYDKYRAGKRDMTDETRAYAPRVLNFLRIGGGADIGQPDQAAVLSQAAAAVNPSRGAANQSQGAAIPSQAAAANSSEDATAITSRVAAAINSALTKEMPALTQEMPGQAAAVNPSQAAAVSSRGATAVNPSQGAAANPLRIPGASDASVASEAGDIIPAQNFFAGAVNDSLKRIRKKRESQARQGALAEQRLQARLIREQKAEAKKQNALLVYQQLDKAFNDREAFDLQAARAWEIVDQESDPARKRELAQLVNKEINWQKDRFQAMVFAEGRKFRDDVQARNLKPSQFLAELHKSGLREESQKYARELLMGKAAKQTIENTTALYEGCGLIDIGQLKSREERQVYALNHYLTESQLNHLLNYRGAQYEISPDQIVNIARDNLGIRDKKQLALLWNQAIRVYGRGKPPSRVELFEFVLKYSTRGVLPDPDGLFSKTRKADLYEAQTKGQTADWLPDLSRMPEYVGEARLRMIDSDLAAMGIPPTDLNRAKLFKHQLNIPDNHRFEGLTPERESEIEGSFNQYQEKLFEIAPWE